MHTTRMRDSDDDLPRNFGKPHIAVKQSNLGASLFWVTIMLDTQCGKILNINDNVNLVDIFLASTQNLSVRSPDVPTFLSVKGHSVIDLLLLFKSQSKTDASLQ